MSYSRLKLSHRILRCDAADSGNVWNGTLRFWRETAATPASLSITVDLFLFGLAVVIWMVAEARRLGIAFVWVYVVLSAAVAISVAVPLFLIARELKLRASRAETDAVALTRGDLIGFALFALPCLALSVWSLLR